MWGYCSQCSTWLQEGKLITDHVLELEARIMKELYTGARCPALLLIDI